MAAQQVDLQRIERVRRDFHVGQGAKTGVDAVDRLVAVRLALDDRPGRTHAPRSGRRQADRLVPIGDGDQVLERERGAVEQDHRWP